MAEAEVKVEPLMTSQDDVTSRRPPSLRDVRFWILPITGMLIVILTSSNYSVYGLLFLELEETFQVSKFKLGWVSSVYSLSGFASGVIGPYLLKRLGYRVMNLISVLTTIAGLVLCSFTPNFYCLYIFYGVLVGFGYNMVEMTQFTLIQDNVKTNIVLATSILTTGFAISVLFWPIVFQVLFQEFSWRGAFLFMGAFGANAFILMMAQTSGLLGLVKDKKNKHSSHRKPLQTENCDGDMDNKNSKEDIEVNGSLENKMKKDEVTYNGKRSVPFTDYSTLDVLISLSFFLYQLGEHFSYYMTAVRMDSIGLTKQQIVTVMSTTGAVGILRFLPCYLIDRFGWNRTKVSGWLSLALGVSTMVSITLTSFVGILIFYLCWGIMQSVFFTLSASVFVDVFGKHRVHKAMGMRTIMGSLSFFASLPLSGILLDTFNDVNIPIILFGAVQVLAAILIFAVVICAWFVEKRKTGNRY